MKGSLRAALELMRLSNSPTIISNTLAGACLGGMLIQSSSAPTAALPADWPLRLILAAISSLLLYTGGMIYNDVADLATDLRERPGRPIPSGRISRRGAIWLGMGCHGLAILSARIIGMDAALVAFGIFWGTIIYNLSHRRSRWSVLLLGLCRAGVYLLAAVAMLPPGAAPDWDPPAPVLIGAGGMLLYIVGFSLIARHEASRHARASVLACLAIALLALAPVIAAAAIFGVSRLPSARLALLAAAAAALLAALLRASRAAIAGRFGPAIMRWIAAIALIDAALAAVAGPVWAAPACGLCWVACSLAHRRIPGS